MNELGAVVKMFKVENSFFKNQCYLIYNNRTGILIDPAWDYDLINGFIQRERIKIKAVLLTHSHKDHTDLATKFSLCNDIPVYISNVEIESYDIKIPNLRKVFHLKKMVIDGFNIMPILTPGHTLGSTCYLLGENLFSGDTVFIEGVGICNKQNASKLYDSINFLKKYLKENTLFWPGHSFGETPGKDFNYLLRHNIYFNFTSKKDFIAFRTRENKPDPLVFK
ncbi:MBL fold metallo-hydrolase [Aquimarina algicola]|uniref:MBL fold metallo-hydrolase n=1 Tax=Aquimarina algicola TaxID=2589995 RepID=A0A504JF52_9FLAO|nr:MBL fold metallo-hydrolase [Aquimarina algicola]TPN89314.1 MBL fold metallo-hydrolase [Aquimarina algicola]